MRSAHAHAIRSETAVYAPEFAPVPDDALARLERAGPRAVEDHELLGLVGVRVDASILAAAGGLRGLLDDPAAPPRTFLLAREDRARVHALLDLHLRGRLRTTRPRSSPATTTQTFMVRCQPTPKT